MTSETTVVDEQLGEHIDNTVESEQDFQDYIKQKRQEKSESQIRRDQKFSMDEKSPGSQDELSEFDDTDPELTDLKSRVKEVDFDSDAEELNIVYEDNDGCKHSEEVDASIPEDKENKYVRLCEWVGVNPEYPTELRGEIIPTNEGSEIDYPPIQKRLNPYSYATKRKIYNSYNFIQSREWLYSRLKTLGIGASYTAPIIVFLLSYVSLVSIAEFTRHSESFLLDTVGIIGSLPILFICLLSFYASFVIYAKLLTMGIYRSAVLIGKTCIRIHRFFFPKS